MPMRSPMMGSRRAATTVSITLRLRGVHRAASGRAATAGLHCATLASTASCTGWLCTCAQARCQDLHDVPMLQHARGL